MSRAWRISVYDLALGADWVTLPGDGYRFVYAVAAPLEGRSATGEDAAGTGSGFLAKGPVDLRGRATAWIYDVDPTGAEPVTQGGLSLVLSRRFKLPDGGKRLIRADRVESASGAQTPRHGHRGPGIRRLLYGRLLAQTADRYDRIEPGQPWFETGDEPVVGTNIHTGDTAFVRVMLLPDELAGGIPSFVPTTPEDANKPRGVTYRLFGELMALER